MAEEKTPVDPDDIEWKYEDGTTSGGSSDKKKDTDKDTNKKKESNTVKEPEVDNKDTKSKDVKVDKTMKVVGKDVEKVNAYVSAKSGSTKVGYLVVGREYQASDYKNGFYYFDVIQGWVHESHLTTVDNTKKGKSTKEDEEDEETQEDREQEQAEMVEDWKRNEAQLTQEEKDKLYDVWINQSAPALGLNETEKAIDFMKSNLNGIWGLPYQFPWYVDPKVKTSNGSADAVFGRIYSDRILTRMPLLMISPGKMDFMNNFSNEEKRATLNSLFGQNEDFDYDAYLSHTGKYYDFKYDSAAYWTYVNAMNHACASYLGIEDVQVNINGHVGKLGAFKWERSCTAKMDTMLMSSEDFIVFYTDAETTKDETFTNETSKSILAEKVNDFSALAKEVQFIIGSQAGAPAWITNAGETIQSVVGEINNLAQSLLGGSTLIENLTREFSTIATGGKLAFPEIWSDSTFTQSLTAKIKLRCPCPNKVQWYLDIVVPINMLIALTLPRTPTGKNALGVEFKDENSSVNGYMSPFLVRAFYKGIFNCDMGIITSLTIDKGKEGSWTIDGLPSEVDVSIEIKDLYNVMYQTDENHVTEFLSNTCFLNYIANSCGICINQPDIVRSLQLWAMMKGNSWKNKLGYTYWQQIRQGIRNRIYDLYTGYFRG